MSFKILEQCNGQKCYRTNFHLPLYVRVWCVSVCVVSRGHLLYVKERQREREREGKIERGRVEKEEELRQRKRKKDIFQD